MKTGWFLDKKTGVGGLSAYPQVLKRKSRGLSTGAQVSFVVFLRKTGPASGPWFRRRSCDSVPP
jgi:hypothetical protein